MISVGHAYAALFRLDIATSPTKPLPKSHVAAGVGTGEANAPTLKVVVFEKLWPAQLKARSLGQAAFCRPLNSIIEHCKRVYVYIGII